MENLKVVEALPGDVRVGYNALLYNQPSFLRANNAMPQLHFYLLDTNDKLALAHLAFSREESEALSPYRAPFGGLEIVQNLESTVTLFFLNESLRRLKEHNVRFVKIKMPPTFYLPDSGLIYENLLSLGFTEKRKETYHAITVDDQSLVSKISVMEQRRLKKGHKEGLIFRLVDRSEFLAVFDFIKGHREAKGQKLSMDWDELKMVIRSNPEHYIFAAVYREKELIAASLLVKNSSKVIYSFYPAHDAAYNSLSPMVFLLDALYTWCLQQGVEFIDLGTSYIGNEPNQSLVNFKEHMGGQPYVSHSFRKALSSWQKHH